MVTNGIVLEYLLGGGLVVITTFSIATYVRIGKIKDEINDKIGRVYGRLDEVKKATDEKFVSKDICGILHRQTAEDIVEIKVTLRELLKMNERKN